MPRFRTTKTQVSGYKLAIRRLEDAVVRRDTRLLDSPFASQLTAWGFGMLIFALFGVAGLVVKLINPDPGVGDASFIVTKDGGQYIRYGQAWHPVTNSVSAKLILGGPEEPKTVSNDALEGEAFGLPMGIASAPGQILPNDQPTAPVSVCTTHTPPDPLTLDNQTVIESAVIMGDNLPHGTALDSSTATLVTVYDRSRYWVLFDGKRARIDMNNDTVRAALNISTDVEDNAVVVSPKLLDAIPASSELTVPVLPNRQSTSQALAGYRVGSVITQETPNNPSLYYVVAYDGIQQVSETVARLLATDGALITRNPSASIINDTPRVDVINTRNYPAVIPTFISEDTVCVTWEKDSPDANGKVTFTVSHDLPLDTPREHMSPSITGGDGPSSDRFYTGSTGKGWYVQATDLNDESVTEGSHYYVSAEGIRYPIGTDEAGDVTNDATSLGLNAYTAIAVPWQYLELLPEGPTLSQVNALTVHESIAPPEVQLGPDNADTGEVENERGATGRTTTAEPEAPATSAAREPEEAGGDSADTGEEA